jgi:F-type H+-transporting ATPase subunit b
MLGPVSISLPTLVIELVIFLMTVFLMERMVFDPIRKAWSERERLIQEGLAASSGSQEEAEQARAEVRRILVEARQSAQQQIDSATAAGSRTRDDLVGQATTEFRRLVDEARQQISGERERSAEALGQRIVDLALLAASQVTGKSYDQPQVRELAATVVQQEGLR